MSTLSKSIRSRNSYSRLSKNGFTIVELLIVIIVIAILAALVITAYNGVQIKARNTSRIASAKNWQKVINTYITNYGKYPINIDIGGTGNGSDNCLGSGDYPTDWDANSNEDCYTGASIKHPNSTWNTELQKVSPTLPSFNKEPIDNGSGTLGLGIMVRSFNMVDGISGWPTLVYFLEGTGQKCGLSPVISSSWITTSNPINSGNWGSKGTTCRIKLPDPADL